MAPPFAVAVVRPPRGHLLGLDDEEMVERLHDCWLVVAGRYRRNDRNAAISGLVDAQDESFDQRLFLNHDDSRGLRWTRLANFMKLPRRRDGAIDCDYQRAVAFPGLWVPMDEIERLSRPQEHDPKWRKTLKAIDELMAGVPHERPRIFKNVVVLKNPPTSLHPGLTRLDRLGDGTALLVGTPTPEWVEWLRRTVPLRNVRLLPGPIDLDSVLCHPDFLGLLEAHAEGRLEMRVLKNR